MMRLRVDARSVCFDGGFVIVRMRYLRRLSKLSHDMRMKINTDSQIYSKLAQLNNSPKRIRLTSLVQLASK
jgi:hypothetical protein